MAMSAAKFLELSNFGLNLMRFGDCPKALDRCSYDHFDLESRRCEFRFTGPAGGGASWRDPRIPNRIHFRKVCDVSDPDLGS